jgi:hypothetical protein
MFAHKEDIDRNPARRLQWFSRSGGTVMAVRDVVDEDGTKWKIWSVTQSSIHPKTAAEDYLGDFSEGWLCFECDNQRRRLARFPQDWDRLSDKDLMRLLKTAQVVAPRRNTPPKPGDSAKP